MSNTNQYSLYSGTVLPQGGSPALHLTQLHGRNIDNGLRIEEHILAGTVDRATSLVMEGNPIIGMMTYDLAGAFNGGIGIRHGYNAAGGATFRYQQRASNLVSGSGTVGTFMTGSKHITVTADGGMVMPQRLAFSQGQLGQLDMTFFAQWTDRSLDPLVLAVDQALAQSPAYSSLFTLGPFMYDGSPIDGCIGWELQCGLGLEPRFREGLTYPVEHLMNTRLPRIVVRFDTPEIAAWVGNLFMAQQQDPIQLFGRRKNPANSDGNYADDATEHLKLSVPGGSWKVDPFGATGTQNVPGQITLVPTGVLELSLASAIE